MDTDKWDIEAKPDTPGMPSPSQMRVIVQKLLAERFGLQFHEEKRKLAAYALIVSKDGPKMTKTADASLSPNFVVVPSRRADRAKRHHGGSRAVAAKPHSRPAAGGQDGTRGAVGLHDEVDAG